MEFDLYAAWKVLARLIDHHMPAGHEKKPAIPLEEEATRSSERTLIIKGRDPDGGQQQRFNHGRLYSSR
jgi:hypothetical protein